MNHTPPSDQRGLLLLSSPSQPASLEFTHSRAVVVGINDYRHVPRLRTAAPDAEELARILGDEYGYEVHLLTQEVTLARLRALLASLSETVGPDDRLVVYFAGHGIALEGSDGPAGYLVPEDGRPEDRNTFLRMDEFHDALLALPCRHSLIILDCCFAGAMRWASTRALLAPPEVIHRERYERFIRDPAWQVLTSAAHDQTALDVLSQRDAPDAGSHSPFALALFAALRGAGDVVPAGGGDGVITAAELYLYLRQAVEVQAEAVAGHFQTPGLWPLKKHGKGEYIFLVPGHDLNLPPAPELTYDNNPYRGLQAFEEEHATLFFGRTALVQTLAETVAGQPLTIVLGASGTGKSSVVKAGLLPYLRQAQEQPWHILPPMRPTESPLRELTLLLEHHLPDVGQLQTASTTLRGLLNLIAYWGRTHPERKLLLMIDQFEELVTLCRNEDERAQFINLLQKLLAAMPEQLRLILTLRSDFEPQFAGNALQAHWQAARFIIPPMTQAELREAIEGPAGVRVLYFEPPALVDRLIDEVIQTPGALPLLSFTLSELYIRYLERRGNDRALSQGDYELLGGVVGALRNRATAEYTRLDAAHQATMERVLLRMVASEGGELARRRVPRAELVYPDAAENARVAEVRQRLEKARLVVGGNTEDGVAYIEPAHDALVRAWDKLLVWHRAAEAYLPLQRRLTQAADEWAAESNVKAKTDLLWKDDPRLPQVEEALAGNPEPVKRNWAAAQWLRFRDLWRSAPLQVVEGHWLNALELEFVRRSVAQRRKEARRLVGTVAGVMAVLVALVVVAWVQANLAEIARKDAEEKARIALSRQLAVQSADQLDQSNWNLSLLLAIQAGRIVSGTAESSEVLNALHRTLDYPAHLLFTLPATGGVWSPDGSRILVSEYASPDYTNRVYNAQTGAELFTLSNGKAWWSPDSSRILVVAADGRAWVWDAQTRTPLLTFAGQVMRAQVKWSPDGRRILATGCEPGSDASNCGSGMVQVWDTATGILLFVLPNDAGEIERAEWSPDGNRILTVDGYPDFTVRLWDVSLEPVDAQPLPQTKVALLTFPNQVQATWLLDGSRILTLGCEQKDDHGFCWKEKLWVWNTDTGDILFSFSSEDTWRSPDGTRILGNECNHRNDMGNCTQYTSQVRDAATGQLLATLPGRIEPLAWNVNSSRIMYSQSGTMQVWDTTTNLEFKLTGGQAMQTGEWNTDNSRILVAGCDRLENDGCFENSVRVLDAVSGKELVAIPGYYASWNPDGHRIMIGGQVWDISPSYAGPQASAQTGTELPVFSGHPLEIWEATWSIDGSRLMTTGCDEGVRHCRGGTTRIWDTASGAELFTLPRYYDGYFQAAWNADEKLILTAGCNFAGASCEDSTISVWDALSASELYSLTITGSARAEWNADGRRILVMGGFPESIVQVWDPTNLQSSQMVTGPLVFPGDSAWWNPDGDRILVARCERRDDQKCLEGTLYMRDAATGQILLSFPVYTTTIWRATWDAAGNHLLTIGSESPALSKVQIWDITAGNELFAHSLPVINLDATWNTTGNQLLIFGLESYDSLQGVVQVWDITMNKQVISLPGYKARWSPNESRLLTISCDQVADFNNCREYAVRVWDTATWNGIFTLHGHTGTSLEAKWNIDGSRLLVAGCEERGNFCKKGLVRVWDALTGKELTTLPGYAAWWNPDSSRIFTGSDERGQLHQYYAYTSDLLEAACQHLTRNMTWQEWRQYLGDEPYRKTCPDLPYPPSVIENEMAQAVALAIAGKSQDAKLAYAQALQWAEEINEAHSYTTLCRSGSLYGAVDSVLLACERAVELAPYDGDYRENRGLARALVGDFTGAVADFNFVIEWLQKWTGCQADAPCEQRIQLCQTWISVLEVGQNPFNEETLEALRNE